MALSQEILSKFGAIENKEEHFQLRLLQCGPGGSGKTTAACTFPNPLIGDLDRKAPRGVNIIPFWNPEFTTLTLNVPIRGHPNRRDAVKKWLRNALPALPEDTTFILDSWTMLQDEFDAMAREDISPYLTKPKQPGTAPEVDGYKIWAHKLSYATEIWEILKTAKCTVIVNCHQQADRNENGMLTGKYKPLMTGQFADRMNTHATMFVRNVVRTFGKLKEPDKSIYAEYYGPKITDITPCYLWQVRSDDDFDVILPFHFKSTEAKYLPASYKTIQSFVPISHLTENANKA